MRNPYVPINKICQTVALLFVLTVTAACGYHLKGTGLRAPEGVRTIAVAVLANRTTESGIESIFTGDLAYEFTRSKVLRVVDIKEADAVLSGSIQSLTVDTISHTENYDSAERRVIITLNLALKRADGNIVWADNTLTDREAFAVSSSARRQTDSNRRAAIEAISKRLSEKIHTRILQDF